MNRSHNDYQRVNVARFLEHELWQRIQDHGLDSSLHVDAVGVKRKPPYVDLVELCILTLVLKRHNRSRNPFWCLEAQVRVQKSIFFFALEIFARTSGSIRISYLS